jgi:hypothetical protein
MPFPIYAAIVSSHLVVTIADRVPEFDGGPFCRLYSQVTSGNSLQDCLDSEKLAHQKLIENWQQYTAHDKTMCVMEEKMAGLPSYVGWLTCLDINANARRVDATTPAVTSAPAAGTGGETGAKKSMRAHRRSPGAHQP